MRRFASHAVLIAAFALVASVVFHGVGVVGLGELTPAPPEPLRTHHNSELEFVEFPPLEPVAVDESDPLDPSRSASPESTAVQVAEEPVIVAPPIAAVQAPPPPPQEATPATPTRNLQSVEQVSDDPSVPAPPDAQFLAAQNRRVEQETAATETRLQSDTPEAAPPPEAAHPSESVDPGHEADPSSEHASEAPPESSETASEAPVPARREPREAATPREGAQAEGHTEAPASGTPVPRPAGAGGTPAPEMESVTIDDGFGTFTVMRPRAAGAGGSPSEPRRLGESGTTHAPGGVGPNLRVGYSNFEAVYGPEQLAEERAARRAAREALASASGSQRRERWDQFRFAAENFLPTITPGNQTALNAAASPFAAWISAVHRRIHAHFADRFLARISGQTGELANENLYTELEIVIDVRGRVLRVAITHTSGSSAFDLGAFSSVLDAQPFPTAPDVILSGDGNVYTRWGFSRGPSACTSQQAAPFILPNPPPLVPMPGVTVDPDEAARARRRHMPADLRPDGEDTLLEPATSQGPLR